MSLKSDRQLFKDLQRWRDLLHYLSPNRVAAMYDEMNAISGGIYRPTASVQEILPHVQSAIATVRARIKAQEKRK